MSSGWAPFPDQNLRMIKLGCLIQFNFCPPYHPDASIKTSPIINNNHNHIITIEGGPVWPRHCLAPQAHRPPTPHHPGYTIPQKYRIKGQGWVWFKTGQARGVRGRIGGQLIPLYYTGIISLLFHFPPNTRGSDEILTGQRPSVRPSIQAGHIP